MKVTYFLKNRTHNYILIFFFIENVLKHINVEALNFLYALNLKRL